ncbi:MAG: hypothetical protein ACO1OF_15090 [Adhaeribacter sp.]
MEELFDNIKRTYDGPANHNENAYDFYNRSSRKDIGIIRELLNSWFKNIPDGEKKELKSRFRNEFDSSFYELFLHQLFLNLGFRVEIHPSVPNSPNKPDFLIIKDNLEIYVEAKVVNGKSKEQEAFERKVNEFYDNFSKLDSKDFYLEISTLKFKTDKQPNTRGIIAYFQREINKLDAEKLFRELEEFGFGRIPNIELNDSNIHVIVKPHPVVSSLRDKKRRPIGMYPSETFLGGGEESLKDSINRKAKRYGELDKPFIVCMNTYDIRTSNKIDIENAIWGSLAWSTNPNNREEKWIRRRDGIFLDSRGARLRNLSGILVTKIFPHNIPNANYWLFEHPFSRNKFNFNGIGLEFNSVKEGKIQEVTGNNLDEILKISKNWLQ